jgi:hypothetical protein
LGCVLFWAAPAPGHALISAKRSALGEERVYRVIANDIPPKRKGRPGRKVA